MTFIPESIGVAAETFGPVSAGIVALVAAIVITGFWEFLIQEIKLKRLEQKRRQITATNQNIESDRDQDRGNRIAAGSDRECATNAKSVQASMDHFVRAVARLQKLDSNLMGDNPNIDRATHHLEGDLRDLWSAHDLANGSGPDSKNLPVLLHGNGSKGKLRRQERQRRYR
jgi:hypothetical protein